MRLLRPTPADIRHRVCALRRRSHRLPHALLVVFLLAACSGPGPDSGASPDSANATDVLPTVTIRARSTVDATAHAATHAGGDVGATPEPVGTPLVVDPSTQALLDALPPVSVFPERWTHLVRVNPFGGAGDAGGGGGGACGIGPWAVIDAQMPDDPPTATTAGGHAAPPGTVVAGLYSTTAEDSGTSVVVMITDLSSASLDNAAQIVMDAYRMQANCEPFEVSPGVVVTYSQDDAVVVPGIAADQQWSRSTSQTTANDMGDVAGYLLIFPVGERLVAITASVFDPSTGESDASSVRPLVESAAQSVLHDLSADLPTPAPS